MTKPIIFLALLLSLPTPFAFANVDDYKVCRETLSPAARDIADKVVIQLEPGVDAKQIMRSTVVDMVKNGEVEREIAKESALSAADCLRKLKS